ncbi:cytochrome b ascorbate-dependent protein 3 [Etheostoma spectabile]|uniref:cytochrome b ascorbate-dependent protein 3 n=1 Tax=Etheostoma spectabile TaxID=54343 RepID=UPI0013AF9882|nr:cytochrome b ascorbate-dependent protein 3-like [Etheostoma spectabile]
MLLGGHRSPLWFRSSPLKPVHIWMGKPMWTLSLASCISSINEKLLLTLTGDSVNPCNAQPVEAKFANSLGILTMAFGLVVFGILSKNRWQRPETDSERAHLLLNEGTACENTDPMCHGEHIVRCFSFLSEENNIVFL